MFIYQTVVLGVVTMVTRIKKYRLKSKLVPDPNRKSFGDSSTPV